MNRAGTQDPLPAPGPLLLTSWPNGTEASLQGLLFCLWVSGLKVGSFRAGGVGQQFSLSFSVFFLDDFQMLSCGVGTTVSEKYV